MKRQSPIHRNRKKEPSHDALVTHIERVTRQAGLPHVGDEVVAKVDAGVGKDHLVVELAHHRLYTKIVKKRTE